MKSIICRVVAWVEHLNVFQVCWRPRVLHPPSACKCNKRSNKRGSSRRKKGFSQREFLGNDIYIYILYNPPHEQVVSSKTLGNWLIQDYHATSSERKEWPSFLNGRPSPSLSFIGWWSIFEGRPLHVGSISLHGGARSTSILKCHDSRMHGDYL